MHTPIDRLLDAVQWEVLPPPQATDLPYATHSGVVRIGDAALRCYQLNNGQRVFDAEDIERFFGGKA